MSNSPWATKGQANTAPGSADDALALFANAPEQAETTGGPIPAGRYLARLEGGGLEQSGRGNWCFAARWILTGGAFSGRRLLSRHWMTAAAVSRTKQEIGSLGLTTDHLRGLAPLPPVLAELSVKTRADECGDIFNEIRRIAPARAAMTGHEGVQNAPQGQNTPVTISIPHQVTETPPGPIATCGGDDAFLDAEFGEDLF